MKGIKGVIWDSRRSPRFPQAGRCGKRIVYKIRDIHLLHLLHLLLGYCLQPLTVKGVSKGVDNHPLHPLQSSESYSILRMSARIQGGDDHRRLWPKAQPQPRKRPQSLPGTTNAPSPLPFLIKIINNLLGENYRIAYSLLSQGNHAATEKGDQENDNAAFNQSPNARNF